MKEPVHILGAGLVGSLLGLGLAKKGFDVTVFEKRPDPKIQSYKGGRSINLALSHRGIHALKSADVFERIHQDLIPMYGRMIHTENGTLTMQPYGRKGQYINSVSRAGLNQVLIEAAREEGVHFLFDEECTRVDFEAKTLITQHKGKENQHAYEILFAADGAFSPLRRSMESTGRSTSCLKQMDYSYKELSMPSRMGIYAMEPNYLHIWPRKNFMLIALPNPDSTFTCTLFLPSVGVNSFDSLQHPEAVAVFFQSYFSDVIELIPDLGSQFQQNPTSSLVTVRSYPWATADTLLLGDASHAIVPFYGQGMNAGFEDVRLILNDLPANPDWKTIFDTFEKSRKADVDAIADLALGNFIEMRDKVSDARFLEQKKLEKRLNEEFPEEWIPLYSLVTFSDTPYSECLKLGKIQQSIMDSIPDPGHPDLDLRSIIESLNESKRDGLKAFR